MVRPRLEDCWSPEAVALSRLVGELAERQGVSAYLVGGPVRDLLRGRPTADLDIAVEGDALALAEALADRTRGSLTVHDRFGTATVRLESGLQADLARTRLETYPTPGALPEVEPAPLDEDLRRRDFTIHAMAARLGTEPLALLDFLGGRLDLELGLLRGLHPRTFVDDPTRIIRAARYAALLDLSVEPQTLAWLRTAVADGVLATVTGPRLWGELQRTLAASEFVAACELLRDWRALPALGLPHGDRVDLLPELQAGCAALDCAADVTQRSLAVLGMMAGEGAAEVGERFGLAAEERLRVVSAAEMAASPPASLFAGDAGNSILYGMLHGTPMAGLLALWATHPVARGNLRRWTELRHTRLDITGDDLQAAGHAPGPGFREALAAALTAKLDHGADRGQQLQAALEALRHRQRNQ